MKQAVITADIEASTQLRPEELKHLFKILQKEIDGLAKEQMIQDVVFFRGDSFQARIRNPENALLAGLILKTCINKHALDQSEAYKRGEKVKYDIAIAIGLGEITRDDPLEMSNEKPFILSGRGLEELKSNNVTVGIFTGNSAIDSNFETIFYVYEWIMKQWTRLSAELVYHKLHGKTERIIANELGISQSAANQRSHAACWNGLERILKQYKETVKNEYN